MQRIQNYVKNRFTIHLNQRLDQSGQQADIFLATDGQTGHEVIAKVYSFKQLGQRKYLHDNELKIFQLFKQIESKNIVKLIDHETDNNFSYLFFESLSKTLDDRMREGKLSTDEVFKIGKDILSGLKEMHHQDYSHRDLKPDNIMYSQHESVWKLIDLGVVSDQKEARTTLGTELYDAPEKFKDKYEPQRTDIFSVGVLLYQMVTNKFPYELNICTFSNPEKLQRAENGLLPLDETGLQHLDHALKQLIIQMLSINPLKRPSAQDSIDVIDYKSQMLTQSITLENNFIINNRYVGLELFKNNKNKQLNFGFSNVHPQRPPIFIKIYKKTSQSQVQTIKEGILKKISTEHDEFSYFPICYNHYEDKDREIFVWQRCGETLTKISDINEYDLIEILIALLEAYSSLYLYGQNHFITYDDILVSDGRNIKICSLTSQKQIISGKDSRYRAPELTQETKLFSLDDKSLPYAIGILLFEVFLGQNLVKDRQFNQKYFQMNQEMKEFLESLCSEDQNKRFSISQIYQHKFVRNFNTSRQQFTFRKPFSRFSFQHCLAIYQKQPILNVSLGGDDEPISITQIQDIQYDPTLHLSPYKLTEENGLSLDCLVYVINLYRFHLKHIRFPIQIQQIIDKQVVEWIQYLKFHILNSFESVESSPYYQIINDIKFIPDFQVDVIQINQYMFNNLRNDLVFYLQAYKQQMIDASENIQIAIEQTELLVYLLIYMYMVLNQRENVTNYKYVNLFQNLTANTLQGTVYKQRPTKYWSLSQVLSNNSKSQIIQFQECLKLLIPGPVAL